MAIETTARFLSTASGRRMYDTSRRYLLHEETVCKVKRVLNGPAAFAGGFFTTFGTVTTIFFVATVIVAGAALAASSVALIAGLVGMTALGVGLIVFSWKSHKEGLRLRASQLLSFDFNNYRHDFNGTTFDALATNTPPDTSRLKLDNALVRKLGYVSKENHKAFVKVQKKAQQIQRHRDDSYFVKLVLFRGEGQMLEKFERLRGEFERLHAAILNDMPRNLVPETWNFIRAQ
jgi:hypothetical protein